MRPKKYSVYLNNKIKPFKKIITVVLLFIYNEKEKEKVEKRASKRERQRGILCVFIIILVI